MFYVYDIDGLRFQGSLEDLVANRRVEKSRSVKALQYGEEFQEPPPGPNAQAVKAYQQTIDRESMVEPLVHIYQIMSSPVSTITGDLFLIDALLMFNEGNIRQLVVATPEREVLGVLSYREVLKRLEVVDGKVEVDNDLRVADILPSETYSTDSLSDIRRVARVMAYYHLDAMPVLEEGRLVGIVTRGDILRGFAENPKLNLWA